MNLSTSNNFFTFQAFAKNVSLIEKNSKVERLELISEWKRYNMTVLLYWDELVLEDNKETQTKCWVCINWEWEIQNKDLVLSASEVNKALGTVEEATVLTC